MNDSFNEIKQTHPAGESLGTEWPLPEHVEEIARKSSGQFIYASVVIHFLSAPSASPSVRLDIIRGLRPSGRLTPFAQLDALYRHIFSQVEDISATLQFLAYLIFTFQTDIRNVLHFFALGDADVHNIAAPLASVLRYDLVWGKIIFYHASLPDFLRDKGRSGEYCINSFATVLSLRWFKCLESGRFSDLSWGKEL